MARSSGPAAGRGMAPKMRRCGFCGQKIWGDHVQVEGRGACHKVCAEEGKAAMATDHRLPGSTKELTTPAPSREPAMPRSSPSQRNVVGNSSARVEDDTTGATANDPIGRLPGESEEDYKRRRRRIRRAARKARQKADGQKADG